MRSIKSRCFHLIALLIFLLLAACSGEGVVLSGCGDSQTSQEGKGERSDGFLGMDGFLPCLEPMTEDEFVAMSWESKSQMMIDKCIDEFSERTCSEAFQDPEVDNRDALRICAAAYCPRFDERQPRLCDDEDSVTDPHRRAEFYHHILRTDFDLPAVPSKPLEEWRDLQQLGPQERTIMATNLLSRVLGDRSLTKEEKTTFAVPVVLAMFLSIPVDVSPDASPIGEESADNRPPPRLVIRVSAEGFVLEVDNERLRPSGDCSTKRATICLRDSSADVEELLAGIQTLNDQEMSRFDELLTRLLDAYDWPELYNRAVEIRQGGVGHREVAIAADSKIPFAVVVRITDVLRYELEEERYESEAQFLNADYRTEEGEPVQLFSNPLLQIAH